MRVAAFVVVAVLPALVAGQTPRDAAAPSPSVIGQGIIAGTVVADDANGRPVRRAVVTASGAGLNGDRKTVTDDNGHFAVTGLPAGRYTLSVSKVGWVTTYYGSKHPGRPVFGGAPIVLQAGQWVTSVALRLLHGSAVTGVITDAFGRPTTDAQVRLLPMRVENGQRTVDPMGGQAMGMIGQGAYGNTDDRGIYRLYGVLPGDYLVVASTFQMGNQEILQLTADDLQAARRALQPGQTPSPTSTPASGATGGSTAAAPTRPTVAYAPVYYPGALDASNAVVVTVGANEERSGVDFALMVVHTARVQGMVLEPDGRPAPGGQIQLLLPPAPSVLLSGNQFARIFPDGTFTFSGVPPGHYTIVARGPDTSASPPVNDAAGPARGGGVIVMRAGGPGSLSLWATEATAVAGQDVTGLTLMLQHGATIAGRLVWSGTTLRPPADASHVAVRLTPISEDPNAGMGPGMFGGIAQVNATGDLKFTNVAPGRYRVDISMNAGRGMSPEALSALKGWSPRSAIVGDHDAMDLPFEVTLGAPIPDLVVTLTDRLAEISGSVRDAAGHPVSAYRLVAFSADKSLWGTTGRRLKAPVSTDPDGTFRISDLPPGEYFLAAVTDMEPSDLKDAPFLAELAAQAIRLTLGEGEKKVQNVKVPGG